MRRRRRKRSREGAYLEQRHHDVIVAAQRHYLATATHAAAKPGVAEHRCFSTTTAMHTASLHRQERRRTTNRRRHRATLVAVGLGASGGGHQSQIDADHLVRRRKANRTRPISSPETAGDGRGKSVTAQATTSSRERRELGLDVGRRQNGCNRVGRTRPGGFIPTHSGSP
jgi:hypothetical protein